MVIKIKKTCSFDCIMKVISIDYGWKKPFFFNGYPMPVFRWTSDFRFDTESSIVPVWVSLPNLPIYMFNKHCLFSIGSSIGEPLTIDMSTAEISRPSLAKICIQIDLVKIPLYHIRLQCGENSTNFWQEFHMINYHHTVNIVEDWGILCTTAWLLTPMWLSPMQRWLKRYIDSRRHKCKERLLMERVHQAMGKRRCLLSSPKQPQALIKIVGHQDKGKEKMDPSPEEEK